jgi:hypothetical protein
MISNGDRVRLKAWSGIESGLSFHEEMANAFGTVVTVREVDHEDGNAKTVHEDIRIGGWWWPLSAMEPIE